MLIYVKSPPPSFFNFGRYNLEGEKYKKRSKLGIDKRGGGKK